MAKSTEENAIRNKEKEDSIKRGEEIAKKMDEIKKKEEEKKNKNPSFFSRVVDHVNKGMSEKKYDNTPALKEEAPDEYFDRLGLSKEHNAIKNKEKEDSVKRGEEVAKKIEGKKENKKVDAPKATETKNVSTPKATEEKKTSTTKEIFTNAKKESAKPVTMAETMAKQKDFSSYANEVADNWSSEKSVSAGSMADKTASDSTKRIMKYLGGGIVGQIADTIGVYGDMVSTSKHNLAQAYFQASGKGAQYKDPVARGLMEKKIGTMIDSVADAIKENNTKQSDEGFRILGMSNDEAKAIFGKQMYVVGKWMDSANSKSEALIMSEMINNLKNDSRMDDPNFRNMVYTAMKNPEDRIVLAGALEGDSQLAEDYLFSAQQLAMANTRKGMADAEITDKTKQSIINMTNADNGFKTAYANMEKENVAKKFGLELQQLIASSRIMNANASDSEINNRINQFSEKWKKYGVARDQVAGTVKDATGIVTDVIKAVK